jgi:hypothetical protein
MLSVGFCVHGNLIGAIPLLKQGALGGTPLAGSVDGLLNLGPTERREQTGPPLRWLIRLHYTTPTGGNPGDKGICQLQPTAMPLTNVSPERKGPPHLGAAV